MNKGGAGRAFASRSIFFSAAGAGSGFGCSAGVVSGSDSGATPGAGGGALGSVGGMEMASSIRPREEGAATHPEVSVSPAQTGLELQHLCCAHSHPDKQANASNPVETSMARKVTGHPFPGNRLLQPEWCK
jgi:hypothetical protein